MNEDRLSSLLQEFSAPLVADHIRPASPRPARALRWGLAGAGLVAASVAAFALLPVLATAATLRRIEGAIKNAKSMIAVSKAYSKSRPQGTVYSTTWYRDGKWRLEVWPNRPLAKTFILGSGMQYIYSPKFSTVTAEPVGNWWYEGELSGLDLAKFDTDVGFLQNERSVRVEARKPIDGREVYALVMRRENDDRYRAEILVDKETDLPIRSESSAEGPDHWNVNEYRFNVPVENSRFDPSTFGLPVQDLLRQQEELAKTWQTPMATTSGCHIRDVWQNPEGMVFLAYSAPKSSMLLPATLSEPQGTKYLRLRDMHPGEGRGDTNASRTFTFGKEEARIAVWVPVAKPPTLPRELVVGLARREVYGAPPVNGPEPAVVERAKLSVETGTTEFPPYATTLVLNDYDDQLRFLDPMMRADWYRALGDYENELPWRWQAYDRAHDWLPSYASQWVAPIAVCLRKLGREAEAAETERRLLHKDTPKRP